MIRSAWRCLDGAWWAFWRQQVESVMNCRSTRREVYLACSVIRATVFTNRCCNRLCRRVECLYCSFREVDPYSRKERLGETHIMWLVVVMEVTLKHENAAMFLLLLPMLATLECAPLALHSETSNLTELDLKGTSAAGEITCLL